MDYRQTSINLQKHYEEEFHKLSLTVIVADNIQALHRHFAYHDNVMIMMPHMTLTSPLMSMKPQITLLTPLCMSI